MRRKTPMAKKSKLRRKITKWHRRIGLISAIFVFILSATGFLLNHTSAFSLGKRFVSAPWLLSVYDVQAPSVRSFPLNSHWLSQADKTLYLNGERLNTCEGELVGGAVLSAFWVAACSEGLMVYAPDNTLIEKIDGSAGLSLPVLRFGLCTDGLKVCVKHREGIQALDIDALAWQDTDASSVQWSVIAKAPAALEQAVVAQATARVISWEKLLLDLHAGRYFGPLGPLFMDIVALLFCIFAGTGIYMWSSKRKSTAK